MKEYSNHRQLFTQRYFNRTKLELKEEILKEKVQHEYDFNRTKLELKEQLKGDTTAATEDFNRTKLELKVN